MPRTDRYLKYTLIAPAFFLIALTILYPVGSALRTSVMDWRLSQSTRPTDFVGLDNYSYAFFTDPSFGNAVSATMIFVVGSVVSCVVCSVLIALLFARQGRAYTLARTILVLPFAMSPALQATSFRFFLSPEFGLFDRIIKSVIPALEGVALLSTPALAMMWLVFADVWNWTPFFSLMLIGGLLSIPRETIEAAQVDGAGPWRIFWTITFPLLLPLIAVVAILKTIFSFKMFDYAFLMTGGGPGESTTVLSLYAYRMGFHSYDMGYASAIAFTLALGLLIISAVYYWLFFRAEKGSK